MLYTIDPFKGNIPYTISGIPCNFEVGTAEQRPNIYLRTLVACWLLLTARCQGGGAGVSIHLKEGTQGLQCSSFLVMTYFLVKDCNILPKKELLCSPWVVMPVRRMGMEFYMGLY